jgi:hypothetical protein
VPCFGILSGVQSQNSAGLISEAECVPIITACLLENNETIQRKRKKKMVLKDWLEKRSDFRHDNLPREQVTFLPLSCRVYLQVCLSAFGKSLEIITPFIHKAYMIMVDCFATLQMRSYIVKIFVQLALHKLFHRLWAV